MGKRRVPKSVIVRIEIERIPDIFYRKLVSESNRRSNINTQISELPNVSLAKIEAFSARKDGELREAEKYFLGIFRRALKEKPNRIIFRKIRRKERKK